MKTIYLLIISVLFVSCDKMLLDDIYPNDPVANFESFWNEFDAKYGMFEIKKVDWDLVHEVYRPQVSSSSTDQDLYRTLTQMIALLNDNHVALVPTTNSGLPFFQSGILGRMDTIHDFDLELLKQNYLPDAKFEDPFFTYGIVENNIGYIHIEGFSDMPRNLKKPFEKVLSALKDTKAMIIDVRGGYGGEDVAGQFIAGHFTTETIPYMKTRVKSGPGKNDFTPFENWDISPQGEFQYTKPVVVLTHRFTISARETFCLAMKVLPQVTFIGDTTSGAFSYQINRELLNGWGYSVSIGQWLDARGASYEGLGIPPDILVQNKKQDVLNGKDQALETSIKFLSQIFK